MKVTRHLLVLLIVLVCLVPARNALSQSDPKAIARETAAAVDDNAVSREARQASLEKLKEAARLFLSANENLEAARVLNRVGHFQLILNEPQEAMASYKQALTLLKTSPSIEIEVDSLNGLAGAYPMPDQKDAAEEAARKALSLSVKSEYKRGQGEALLVLSDSQNYYDHPLALRTAQEALEVWRALDDKQSLARTYSQIGRCYMAQNMLADSTHNYEEALRLWLELNVLSEQAEALIMLGFIEFRKGDWQSCISRLVQAQGLLDEKAEPGKMGKIAMCLAEAFTENGLPEIGLTHFQRALNYYREAKEPRGIKHATWGLGRTYHLLGKYPEALSQFQEALAVPDKNSLDAALRYQSLGKVYVAMGDAATALNHLQSALAIYTQAGNPKESAQVLGLMGQAHEQRGQFGLARQNYQRALQMFTKVSDRLNEGAVYYALGRLEMQSRNYGPAENYLKQSIDATETVRRVSTSSDLTAAFSATVQERYEQYIECLMIKDHADPTRGLSVRAFQTSELARGRSLAELLKATETNLAPGLDPKLAEQEKSLRQSLRVKEDEKVTLLSRTYKKEELEALEAETRRLEQEYQQVTETIKARYPAYAQISRPTAWDLGQIQEQVVADDETLLLEYSLGADKSYVWAITRNNMTSAELPGQELINGAARKVYELLQNPPDGQTEVKLTQAAEELSQMILSPVAGQLNRRRVIVVADGALNYIPFQLMPLPSGGHEQMLAEHEVINAPSASILGQLQQESARRQQPEKALAAFGDPVFPSNYAQIKGTNAGEQVASAQTLSDEHWRVAIRDIEVSADSLNPSVIQPLFFAKRELANLQDVSGPDTFVATGFDASLDKLKSTDLTRYAILHFATHGILDPKRPEKSGLLLSMVNRNGQPQNGFVGLQEIYRLHLPVDLVVLSACRTGLGKDVKGEGLIGLTRGFMYAGASSVLASLWKVDDEATAELMKRFYANMLQHGMTPAAALRAAQNSIRQEPQWRSPYYWAAFTLQGEYRHVIKPVSANGHFVWLMIFAVGLSLLLLGLAWRYRRHGRMKTA
jgi:CHAT domain-containing protein/tetratricopeptide (TPR) repeat protein